MPTQRTASADAEIAAEESDLEDVAKTEVPTLLAQGDAGVVHLEQEVNSMSRKSALDFLDRVVSTFAAGFIGVALATGISDKKALEAAALAGAVSVAKFLAVAANKQASS